MGSIMAWSAGYAPKNWLFCQGQLLPISQNSALFALLGINYGGDGRITFALPNLAGRTIIGTGQGQDTSSYNLGEISGTEKVTLLNSQLPMHTHAAALGQLTVSSLTVQASNAQATASQALVTTNTIAAPYDIGNATAIAGFNNATPNTNLNTGSGSASVTGSVTVTVAGGNQPFDVVQPYLALNWIICIYGFFPPRP